MNYENKIDEYKEAIEETLESLGAISNQSKKEGIALFFGIKGLVETGYTFSASMENALGTDCSALDGSCTQYYIKRLEHQRVQVEGLSFNENINGNPLFLNAQFIKKLNPSFEKGIDLRSLSSTYKEDQEESICRVLLKGLSVEEVRQNLENHIQGDSVIRSRGKNVEIIMINTLDNGNPISCMMACLKKFVFSKEEINQFVDFYNKCIEEGVDQHKIKIKGVYLDNHTIKIEVEMEGQALIQAIRTCVNEYDIGIVKTNEESEPITVDTLTLLAKKYAAHLICNK